MSPQEINIRIAKLMAQGDQEVMKMLKGLEGQLISEYKSALRSIKGMIARRFEKMSSETPSYNDFVQYNRLTNLELEIASQIKELTGRLTKTTRQGFEALMTESFYRTAYGLEVPVGVKLGLGVLNAETIKGALINQYDRITWPGRLQDNALQYTKMVKTELTQGLIRGEGYVKIAKRVTRASEIDAVKSIRIMRTEGHRAQSAGRLIALDRAEASAGRLGITMRRVWVATLDARTRDSHQAMDGQFADEEGMFTFPDGLRTEGPGMTGIAAEDINCRCTVRAEIEGMPVKSRKDNETKGIIDYVKYEEWRGR